MTKYKAFDLTAHISMRDVEVFNLTEHLKVRQPYVLLNATCKRLKRKERTYALLS